MIHFITASSRASAHLFAIAALLVSGLSFAESGPSATAAGETILVTGLGTATDADGNIRVLKKGSTVHSGEILNTGANSYLNVKFSDGAFMLLRPNTRFTIAQYAYAAPVAPSATAPTSSVLTPTPAPPAAPAAAPSAAPSGAAMTPQRAFFRLLKGGFRTVSGLIGKANRSDYEVTTPVATIGIRGTDYYAYICDLACASDPVVADSLDVQHIDARLALGATLNGVIGGSIVVTNAAGSEEILAPGQFMLTLTDGRQIRIPQEPKFLRVSPFPNPLTICPA
jgi:hypothetical protein